MPTIPLVPWFEAPRGRYLLAWEQHEIDRIVADVFGFHAVQLGLCGQDFLHANRMPQHLRCRLADDAPEPAAGLALQPEELPFAAQSVDLIVLPHVLEFASQPHQVLREAERVLVPEGHLVITGFNPFSLWGLRRALSGNFGERPWQGQYLSVTRLKDWLSLLGFECRLSRFGCYAPPAAHEVWLRRWAFLDSLGKFCWPILGGVYVLHAVKRVEGMRLITPRWVGHKAHKKAMVPVAQKNRE